MCVENAEGGAEANAQYGYANDGNQDENARNVPTHHETVDMSKKKGQRPKQVSVATERATDKYVPYFNWVLHTCICANSPSKADNIRGDPHLCKQQR